MWAVVHGLALQGFSSGPAGWPGRVGTRTFQPQVELVAGRARRWYGTPPARYWGARKSLMNRVRLSGVGWKNGARPRGVSSSEERHRAEHPFRQQTEAEHATRQEVLVHRPSPGTIRAGHHTRRKGPFLVLPGMVRSSPDHPAHLGPQQFTRWGAVPVREPRSTMAAGHVVELGHIGRPPR